MKNAYSYKAISKLDLMDPKVKILNKLNIFALISISASCVLGALLNYCLRMPGEPGGFYLLYIICGGVLCLIYPYLHEYAHALAVLICRGKMPNVRFGKLAAYCGSPDIVFGKASYFFVTTFPFIFFCAALIPLCVLLPPLYFVLPFMPLMYNVFGSVADFFMLHRALASPRRSIVVDCGTDVTIYMPASKG